MGKEEWELALLHRVAQKCREAICQERPDFAVEEHVGRDDRLEREYVVLTLRKSGDLKGYEFIETASTFLTPAKAKQYVDILKSGHYLGIVVPGHSRDRAVALRSQFRETDLMNPVFFVYDQHGDIILH